MFKKELFSKVVKDYNNRLEEILEEKTFSLDVKNLLLSMLYKIENSYEDYSTVKRNVCKKKYFVEKILNIIDKKCKEIELIKMVEGTIPFQIEKGKIICYQNEKTILDAILNMVKKDIYLGEIHETVAVAMEKMLDIGTKINNAEVIRDFNGWNWDISSKEIENFEYNIIYQNLIILLGNEFMQEWVNDIIIEEIEEKRSKPVNYILSGGPEKIEIDNFISSKERENSMLHHMKKMQEVLEEKYNEDLAKEIRVTLEKTVLSISANLNENEKNKIEEEYKETKKELEELQDKVKYLEKQSAKKKEIAEKIKKIDTLLNDKELIKEEYEKQNEKLPNREKIFSVKYFTMDLEKERIEKLEEIKIINRKIEPQEFVKMKTRLEEKVTFYEAVAKGVKENLLSLQKAFLKCYEQEIEKAESKKEMTELIYCLRYYLLLPTAEEKQIKNENTLKARIEKVEEKLIEKACEQKVLTTFSEKDKKLNKEILKNIFVSKIITLEEMIFVLKYGEDVLSIEICDENIHELTTSVKITEKTELSVKLNKKIKVWE